MDREKNELALILTWMVVWSLFVSFSLSFSITVLIRQTVEVNK